MVIDFFKLFSFFAVAICDLVYDFGAFIRHPQLQKASRDIFRNMKDVRETAFCSFTGITHTSETDFQMLLAANIGHVQPTHRAIGHIY